MLPEDMILAEIEAAEIADIERMESEVEWDIDLVGDEFDIDDEEWDD